LFHPIGTRAFFDQQDQYDDEYISVRIATCGNHMWTWFSHIHSESGYGSSPDPLLSHRLLTCKLRTGGTGYIGGTVLDTLVSKHPEYKITVLLRRVPESFSKRYPKVNITLYT
jgi:hypothetical protein